MGLRLHPKMIRKMGFSTWAVRIARSWWLAVKANCKTAVCYVVGGRVVSCEKFDMMVVESPIHYIITVYTHSTNTAKERKGKEGSSNNGLDLTIGMAPAVGTYLSSTSHLPIYPRSEPHVQHRSPLSAWLPQVSFWGDATTTRHAR